MKKFTSILIASDVKHSFWIPAVGGKLDTNVENVNKFYLTFEKDSSRFKRWRILR